MKPARARKLLREGALHAALGSIALLTLLPFIFTLNNSFRTNTEMFHSFFGMPDSFKSMASAALDIVQGKGDQKLIFENEEGDKKEMTTRATFGEYAKVAFKGYALSWKELRRYMVNSFVICFSTAVGVLLMGSVTAYLLARYRFPGYRGTFLFIISTMMFPGVLTFVPSFMLVKWLGLLDTYSAMLLPYWAGGQVFAIFVFKSFFEGLPEDLFESARIDGAGHFQIYKNIVFPLSKPIFSVVIIMNILGTWNNFLWPFVTNTTGKYHPVSSGLFVMATSSVANNYCALYAAYLLSSIPLLILFSYATKPFIQGLTSGAFKA